MGRTELLLGLLVLSACPPFAPPIRGLQAGMPGRLGAGQLEVGGTTGGTYAPTVGGPHVALGLSDGLLFEAGANLNLVEGNGSRWATGWGGVRLTRRLPVGRDLHLAGDLELGAGAGAGGLGYDSCAQPPARSGASLFVACHERDWTQLFASGAYGGFGLGLQWKWLGVFVRGRLDAAASSAAPTTLWPTAMLGLEVRPFRWLSFGVGGGYAGYWNSRDRLVNFWFYQAQLALIFDVSERTAR